MSKKEDLDNLILENKEFLEHARDAFPEQEEIIKLMENNLKRLENSKQFIENSDLLS